MLSSAVQDRLLSLRNLPTIPNVASEALHLIEHQHTSAGRLGRIIEQDQTLTARVLHVANSPFYGFPREISTIDLAIVILGFNAIREIILSLVVQKVLLNLDERVFDSRGFWRYSIFCGTTARFLARKLGYRMAGEAFVAGLMHDIGVLMIAQHFSRELRLIREAQQKTGAPLVVAEEAVLGSHHGPIGAWLAERWNLPAQLIHAIGEHHEEPPASTIAPNKSDGDSISASLDDIDHPLTAIVALSEWFAAHMGYRDWAQEREFSPLNFPPALMTRLGAHDAFDSRSAIEALTPALTEEFEKGKVFNN